MSLEKLYKTILSPHISEKSASISGNSSQYVFKVVRTATRLDIAKAVAKVFKVKVASVRVCNMKPKQKRHGKVMGRTKAWKKAYVTLAAGEHIEFASQEA